MSIVKIESCSSDVLFEHDVQDGIINRTREAIVVAVCSGASLSNADLRGADLSNANLSGANLRGADLSGAHIAENYIADAGRCVVQIGPIGSRGDQLIVFRTNNGLLVVTGCFTGSDDEFLSAVSATHRNNMHRRDYDAAIAFARIVLSCDDLALVAA